MGGTSAEESTYKKKKSFLSKLRRSSRKPRAELVTTPPPKSQQRQPVLETPVKRDPSKNVGNLDFPETLAETPPLTPEERRRSRLEHYGEPTVEPDWKIPVVQQHTEDEDEDQLYMTGEATQEVEDGDLLNVITLEEEGNDVIFDNPSLDNKDKARPPIDSITTSSGVPVITSLGSDSFRPSEVQNFGGLSVVGSYYGTNDSDLMSHDPSQATKKVMRGRTTRKTRQKKILAQAPSARDSAYEGPPRYDWIDIETAAAVKVQAIFRRNQTMRELEKQGITTAAMRNRKRAMKAKKYKKMHVSEDTPSLLRFCGVGFLL
uniref:Uncharacterized protein n=1 Tax=Ditylum brightwellii TaxID=49249 RepID=A0A7S4UHR9_9STRA